MDSKVNRIIEKKQLEDTLKQEFDLTLQKRIDRYLDVKPHMIMPAAHFSPVSGECSRLFRDGYFYGCISLTQAVAEALIRFLCKINSCKPDNKFVKNVKRLQKRGFIIPSQAKKLLKIWERRDDYHHLSPKVERDLQTLERLAKEKLQLLVKIEGEFFGISFVRGKLKPNNPKYWKSMGSDVFLKLD